MELGGNIWARKWTKDYGSFFMNNWQLESVNTVKPVPSLSANQKVMSYKQEIYVVLAQGDQCDCDTGQRDIKKRSRMIVWMCMWPQYLGAWGCLLGAGKSVLTVW